MCTTKVIPDSINPLVPIVVLTSFFLYVVGKTRDLKQKPRDLGQQSFESRRKIDLWYLTGKTLISANDLGKIDNVHEAAWFLHPNIN